MIHYPIKENTIPTIFYPEVSGMTLTSILELINGALKDRYIDVTITHQYISDTLAQRFVTLHGNLQEDYIDEPQEYFNEARRDMVIDFVKNTLHVDISVDIS